jgi:Alfin
MSLRTGRLQHGLLTSAVRPRAEVTAAPSTRFLLAGSAVDKAQQESSFFWQASSCAPDKDAVIAAQRRDWLALVAVHSDCWLLAVAFYNGARLNKEGR